MSWNGAGVYSRGYASWTADAAANLPISATKFDTEDNDFAGGINNCLTKDGQNSPTAALTWTIANAVALTLLRQTDGTVFSIGRSGGANNPALQFQTVDGVGATINLNTPQTLALAVNGTNLITMASSGVAMQGLANANTLTITGSSTSGQSFGEFLQAGTTVADYALLVSNIPGQTLLQLYGDGHGTLGPNSAAGLAWSTAGGVTINSGSATPLATFITAPGNIITARDTSNSFQLTLGDTAGYAFLDASNATNGLALTTQGGSNARVQIGNGGAVVINTPTAATALTINGANGQHTSVMVANNTAGGSFGLLIEAGTNSSDAALEVLNQAASINFFRVFGDGGCLVGAPTGGTLGAGTLNIAGTLAINSQPIYAGIPQNAQNGATYQFVLADANKHLFFTNTTATWTIPANASVAFPIGTAITLVNGGSGAITLAITTDTLFWYKGGAFSTGTRTIAAESLVTILKVSATNWVLTGNGIS